MEVNFIGVDPLSHICPICNGFQNDDLQCTKCSSPMSEIGRYMDMFDDYSPYLEIDGMKKSDGIEDDLKSHSCPHVFECSSCGERQLKIVKEWDTF